MELEKQVVSLELAKRLKELGVKQESLFWWCDTPIVEKDEVVAHRWELCSAELKAWYERKSFSAFTVAELGEMLKECSYDFPYYYKHGEMWVCDEFFPGGTYSSVKEADCRAKMLIYLIENGLLPAKQ